MIGHIVPARNSRGVLALALAVLAVVLTEASRLLTRLLLMQLALQLRLSQTQVLAYNVVSQSVLFVVYAAALVTGILARNGQRKLFAGIAIGVGCLGTIDTLVGLITTWIASAL